jgi:hypothetical protein
MLMDVKRLQERELVPGEAAMWIFICPCSICKESPLNFSIA